MALTPAPRVWKILPKSVLSTSRANATCNPTPQSTMRSLMARLWAEKSHATARMTTRPSSPVKRCIRAYALADDFENQFPVVGFLSGNAEGVLDHLRGFFHAVFLGVVEAAKHRPSLHFFANFDFQDHADGRIDGVFLAVAASPDQVGSQADVLSVDDAHVAAARRGHFAHARGVGKQLELVQRQRIAALRLHRLFELLIARAIHRLFLREPPGFFERRLYLGYEDHAGGQFDA